MKKLFFNLLTFFLFKSWRIKIAQFFRDQTIKKLERLNRSWCISPDATVFSHGYTPKRVTTGWYDVELIERIDRKKSTLKHKINLWNATIAELMS